MNKPSLDSVRIAVIGLGYVGLPLAVEFGKVIPTIGFDVKKSRVEELLQGKDVTLEVKPAELLSATKLSLTSDVSALANCTVFIITVPTPIDRFKRPDLTPLLKASETVGQFIRPGGVVIYESTVYPGATEEDCIPVVEYVSGLRLNTDFFAGYSPERINPGDPERRLTAIKKVTSGSTPEIALFIDELYGKIITAGTFLANSIKVAEAAKVIENTQRDLNIALINELAIIFSKLGIDTLEVLEAAETKWNFLPFRPGLVGGHCIGVDPYYLTHKAQEVGYSPEVILSGRRINDGMGRYAANRLITAMIQRGTLVKGSRVLIMGATFKENCPDLRNSRVLDVIEELESLGIQVDVYDPLVSKRAASSDLGLKLINEPKPKTYDGVMIAVGHEHFRDLGATNIRNLLRDGGVLQDLKGIFQKSDSDLRL